MKKIKSSIINLTAISVFVIFFISPCIAIEIDFDYPNEVEVNKEFEINVLFESSTNYDIKIFVHNSSDEKITREEIISLVENNGKWQDSWNYLPLSVIDNNLYHLKITENSEKAGICIRLRKTGASKFEEICKKIKIVPISTARGNQEELPPVEPIILSNIEKNEFIDVQGKFRTYLSFIFFIFMIVLLLFFILNKI
ncbi:MAG: hypothetical protein AABX85_02585 [Nanoarchaeota archaeon]